MVLLLPLRKFQSVFVGETDIQLTSSSKSLSVRCHRTLNLLHSHLTFNLLQDGLPACVSSSWNVQEMTSKKRSGDERNKIQLEKLYLLHNYEGLLFYPFFHHPSSFIPFPSVDNFAGILM